MFVVQWHTGTDAGTALLADRRPNALFRALTVRENEDERRARPGSATAASCSAAITCCTGHRVNTCTSALAIWRAWFPPALHCPISKVGASGARARLCTAEVCSAATPVALGGVTCNNSRSQGQRLRTQSARTDMCGFSPQPRITERNAVHAMQQDYCSSVPHPCSASRVNHTSLPVPEACITLRFPPTPRHLTPEDQTGEEALSGGGERRTGLRRLLRSRPSALALCATLTCGV